MDRSSLTLGTISGIPIRIHLNWFLIAILVTWSLAGGYFPNKNPGLRAAEYWIFGSLTALLFFSSVLFHELGHALAAIREGVPVKSITLFIFGGVAHIGHEPPTADAEFRIVAAGPLTSLVLAAFYFTLGSAPYMPPAVRTASFYLSQINFILALFNLIPGFPLDGGRLLRAGLWKLYNDFNRATRWATFTGLGIAGLFIIAGLAFAIQDSLFNGLWLAFIGWYLGRAAIVHYRQEIDQVPEGPGSIRRRLFRPFLQPPAKPIAPVYELGSAPVFVEPEERDQKPVE